MGYKLRPGQPSIEVADGPCAGRKFTRGVEYAEIPEAEAHRFELVGQDKPQAAKRQAPAREDAGGEA